MSLRLSSWNVRNVVIVVIKKKKENGGRHCSRGRAKQNRCRELSVLSKFRSKTFLNIQEHPCVDVFEGKERLHGV